MRKGDIIAIVAVTVLTFPILYIVMLFATGVLRIEYGFKEPDGEAVARYEEVQHNVRRDMLAAQNSKIFQAVEQGRADLVREQERLAAQYAQLEILQAEIERQREELASERKRIESIENKKMESAGARSEANEAQTKKLAMIYQAMKPAEAAGILETLPDAQAAAIISRMTDDRQKGKILAALTKDKASRMNRLIK